MHSTRLFCAIVCLLVAGWATVAAAQDVRTDYPAWLAHTTIDFGIGEIRSPFSSRHLEDGYEAEQVHVPNLAARLSLGHRFTEHTSAQLSYLRPARWVKYRNVNGGTGGHSVWTNVISASVRQAVPVWKGVKLYGEGGFGVVTRHGFEINESPVMDDFVYATPLYGAGVEYRVNKEWGLQLGATFLPAASDERQPYTAFMSGGLSYRVQPGARSPQARPEPGAIFHRHLIQGGMGTSQLGDSLNKLVSPVFWEGDARVRTGFSVDYLRNVFHTKRIFSLDLGGSAAYSRSVEQGDKFMTVSLFSVLRLTMLRTPAADVYFNYSVGGPTYISKFIIDGHETGRSFTLRDAVGFGAYIGKGKHLNAEVKIVHYSNGNLLPRNSGVQVPLVLNLGYAF